ncbi:MAG: nickel pincer cofactor biosynthesis protein LarB [Clostridia bacterium]|nr:nickel pincer cofactor biosynthesis protein LarB [Clostridia bacterium]
MNVREILIKLQLGEIDVDNAVKLLSKTSVADLSHTRLDFDRTQRTGFGEVVFAKGKTTQQLIDIFSEFERRGENVLATRVSEESAKALSEKFTNLLYCEIAKTIILNSRKQAEQTGLVAIVSAGTSDMSVAEETRITAEFFGSRTKCFYDCGVAGLHRLIANIEEIRKANVVVAIAGMEGALASVLAGLVKVPVIAVPTSVGYGANFEGLSALLSMINSCANGVSVVNIDNGYGAGYISSIINKQVK